MSKQEFDLSGWEQLTHGGLVVDAKRLRELADAPPPPLSDYHAQELRRRYIAFSEDRKNAGEWVAWVLEQFCGFTSTTGYWTRGSSIGTEWSRNSHTGEVVRPRQLWAGSPAGLLPVFIDDANEAIGRGRGRKAVSNVLQWMRATAHRLALLTNGRQWRLLYAGLDAEAWCEWEAERWFEEGELGKQVDMLRLFFLPKNWTSPSKDQPSALLHYIQESRKGQSDLSALLGERVREAVERLVQAHGERLKTDCADVDTADIYRAAVRVVMRMVVVFFAESRDLLPRSNSVYHRAYGLNGLLEELGKHGGAKLERIAHLYGAWPRVLALFRMVYHGSPHPALTIHAYGGELFELGEANSTDGLKRALWVFENACYDDQLMSDREVRLLLERISRTKVKVRQGKGATWVNAPVDFADLSSEYIGILYEGLLDFELRCTPIGDPMVFLAVGNEPVLPLSRLEAMSDTDLKSLLEKMKESKKSEDGEEEEDVEVDSGEMRDEDGDSEVESGELRDESESEENQENAQDARHNTRSRAERWALRVVGVAGLVKKPKGSRTAESDFRYEKEVAQKARALVKRVVLPGEWFLVRWGGTRKGAGTFYTRPGLAVPTVHRTLRPLAYNAPLGADGKPNSLAPAADWTPKKPEEILALKVCDPACGSGSFPVAALRFLTEALYASLHHHGRIQQEDGRTLVGLLNDRNPSESLSTEMIPCRSDDESFEARLKARLRRHVVERCIYGVDLDPLGVELCRLALWVETMDRDLPFSFLDHKVKCGNGLVGAWFDQFQHYPVMAWKNREAGDKGHTNGVHFQKEAGTKRIKEWVKDVLTPDMAIYVGKWSLFQGAIQDISIKAHRVGLEILAKLHGMPVHDSAERARIYRSEWLGNPEYESLRKAMDLWCACWFWPADALDIAPLPTQFAKAEAATLALSASIAAKKRFFHWELEFPDVFGKSGDGFDAMIGNPPWETAKPNSKEFFSNLDPLYRTYGKQEALLMQTQYFGDQNLEKEWLDYSADFRAQSNFVGYSANAFGDPKYHTDSSDKFGLSRGKDNDLLHQRWREARQKSVGYADAQHGFRHQGAGDVNLYKLFLEQAHTLLRVDGRIGLIVPSGIYSDYGSQPLRKLFLDQCQWVWLFGFENKYGIFEIHRSFKFNPVIIQKGGKTASIHTAFMRRNLEDWERAEDFAVPYDRSQVEQFSPKSLAILEIQGEKDLEILEKIYSNSVLLGDDGPDGWGVKYATEFHMTNDSKLFPPRPKWEEKGYRPDEYSRWLLGAWRPIAELWEEMGVDPLPEGARRVAQPPYDTLPIPRAEIAAGIILSREADAWIREMEVEDVALPLYEGRMIGQFDFSQKGWVSGKGRGSVWNEIDWKRKVIMPQYLMRSSDFFNHGRKEGKRGVGRVTIMDVTGSTNARTAIAAMTPFVPNGHSAPLLFSKAPDVLVSVLNSFAFDFVVRLKLPGNHLVWTLLDDMVLPLKAESTKHLLQRATEGILLGNSSQAVDRILHGFTIGHTSLSELRQLESKSIIDAIVFALFSLDKAQVQVILDDCDHPTGFNGSVLNAKGFWRIDKEKDPELRHTVLTLVAFHDLQAKIKENGGDRDKGIEAFLNQNDGEGWQIPETLRLADYGLGHDERALEHQPVASRLGPRYYDWQLAQTAEESWKECHLHARNLLGEAGYQQLLQRIAAEQRGEVYVEEEKGEDDDVPRKKSTDSPSGQMTIPGF